MDTCRSWLIIGAIIALVSLTMPYRNAGMDDSTLWVGGGVRGNSSMGSRYVSGKAMVREKPGYLTNQHAFLFLPLAVAVAFMAGEQASRTRKRTAAFFSVFFIIIAVLVTKDGNWTGNGFLLGLVGIGASIYGFRLAGHAPILSPGHGPPPLPKA